MERKTKTKKEIKSPVQGQENLETIRGLVDTIEDNLRSLKKILFTDHYQSQAAKLKRSSEAIEGVFDGETMIDKAGKRYPVPANYASKSKLVPGDILKLTIGPEGEFIFKQIGPLERKKLLGVVFQDRGRFYVKAEGKNYHILKASVTYFQLKEGERVTIIVPRYQETTWAAVENRVE